MCVLIRYLNSRGKNSHKNVF